MTAATSDQLRFGILGTGNIAGQFAAGVAGASRSVVTAVGSRSGDSAAAFAATHAIPAAHGSYEAVLADDTVDAIYISLPNHLHCQWAIQSLEAGKHVLCEKPVAMNLAEAEQMYAAADRTGRLLIEAFMYRCHPLTRAVQKAVADGAIGRLRLIKLGFNYCTSRVDGNVRFQLELGGGALMDIGCYCLSYARLFAGDEPTAAHAVANLHPSGVDEMAVGTLDFPSGIQASFTCGMRAQADNTAMLCGEAGYIQVPIPWKPPVTGAAFRLRTMNRPKQDGQQAGQQAGKQSNAPAGPSDETFTFDAPGPLYGLEADCFADAVRHDAPPFVTPADTLGNMAVLDQLRLQIGLRFPADG